MRAEKHTAGGWLHGAKDCACRRRLPATTLADERERFPRLNRERDVVDRLNASDDPPKKALSDWEVLL
jgi:hypothetical protein